MTTTYVGLNDVHLTREARQSTGSAVSSGVGAAPAARRSAGPPSAPAAPRGIVGAASLAAAAGELVQIDGSPFDWLGPAPPPVSLLGAIDDATSDIVALHFRPAEDLHGYAMLVPQMFTDPWACPWRCTATA